MLAALLVALPVNAWAECAWVLWTTAGSRAPGPGQAVIAAFPKVEDCHTALAAVIAGMKQKHGAETWVSQPKGWGSYDDPTRGKSRLDLPPRHREPARAEGERTMIATIYARKSTEVNGGQ